MREEDAMTKQWKRGDSPKFKREANRWKAQP